MDDPTFLPRAAIGTGLLAGLVVADHLRGRGHRRLREYGFLVGCGALGAGYALLHDLCTYALSADYFVVGKGLEGATVGFWPDVAWLASRAGWTAGLVVGCVLLLANNPHTRHAQLRYVRLAGALVWPVAVSLLFAVVGAWLGPSLLRSVADAPALQRLGVVDVTAFLSVWGVHIGSYAGALVGLVVAATRVRSIRAPMCEARSSMKRRLSREGSSSPPGRSPKQRAFALVVLATLLAVPAVVWYRMIRMPGASHRGPLPAATGQQLELAQAPRQDVEHLAIGLGERNFRRHGTLERSADWIEMRVGDSGLTARRQTFQVAGKTCHNLEVELTGSERPDEIVIVGAHYDSALGTPGQRQRQRRCLPARSVGALEGSPTWANVALRLVHERRAPALSERRHGQCTLRPAIETKR